MSEDSAGDFDMVMSLMYDSIFSATERDVDNSLGFLVNGRGVI